MMQWLESKQSHLVSRNSGQNMPHGRRSCMILIRQDIKTMMDSIVPDISDGYCIMYFIPVMGRPDTWLVRQRWHAPVLCVAGDI